MDFIHKLIEKAKDVWPATKKVVSIAACYVKDFFVGLYNNAEGVIILSLAVSGLASLLGEVPFWLMLPMWVESPMVIPVFCVIVITLIVKSMERRNKVEAT